MNEYIKFIGTVDHGEGVIFFPNSVIGRPPMAPQGTTMIDYSKIPDKPVYIGDYTVVGSNVVIYNNVKIGKNCLIGDGVHIREDVTIGDNCIVGIGTKVGARTTIGNGTRVMDLSNVASDAVLEENVFIGPGVIMGNDNTMGRESMEDGYSFSGPVIRKWATIGMNSTILPGIIIGKDTLVAAGSVVTRSVGDGVVVMGVPAKFVRNLNKEELRCSILEAEI